MKTFDAMSRDPLWLEFSAEELRRVEAFIAMWRLESGHRVLEPGCGTGRLTERLSVAVGGSLQVLACDPSARMIEKARGRNLPGGIEFRRAPALDLDCRADSFDAVICFNVLPHLVPAAEHLAAFRRWLKPGAALWICHTAGRECINAIHRDAGMHDHLLPETATLRRLLERSGYEVVGAGDAEDHFWCQARRA